MTSAPPTVRPLRTGVLPTDLQTLGKNSIIARLGAHDVGPVLNMLDEVAVVQDAIVVDPRSDDAYMFFILQGTAVVRRGSNVVRRLREGDHFGELAVLGLQRRTAYVVAESTMRLARLSRRRFQSLASTHPLAALHMLEAVITELGGALVDLTDTMAERSDRRTATLPLELHVRVDGAPRTLAVGTPLRNVLPRTKNGETVVLGLVDNKPVSLDAPIVSAMRVDSVTAVDELGHAARVRSAQLLCLEAAHAVVPGLNLDAQAPFEGLSVIVAQVEEAARASVAVAIEAEMNRLVKADVLFSEQTMTVEEAAEILRRQGWQGAAALQETSRASVTTLATCGRIHALSNEPLVPSAGCLADTRLRCHPHGFLLDVPRVGSPREREERAVREVARPRFFSPMATLHRDFLASMGVTTVGDFNAMCVQGDVARLIRAAEAFHEKHIAKLAEDIAARRPALRAIAIAGPSSSGKTTFIRRLSVQLEVAGIHPVYLSLDDYYVDRERTPRDERGEYDFEAVEALDCDRLRSDLGGMMAGARITTPRYDFKSGKSLPEGGGLLSIGPREVLLVEGIHALNDAIWPAQCERASRLRVFVHPSVTLAIDRVASISCADARLVRRIVRDRHQRGVSAAENIQRWASVERGERLHIYPALQNADTVFDTSLSYELSVLKVYAERYLLEVPRTHPSYPVALRLRQLVEPIVAMHPDHVPPTSLLREFIGGSSFEP